MKFKRSEDWATLALGLLVVLTLHSCLFGGRARQNVLLPATLNSWTEVRIDFDAGLEDGILDGDLLISEHTSLVQLRDRLELALADGNRGELALIPWDQMEVWAKRGIAAQLERNEVSAGVALSLYEQLVQFRKALSELGVRVSMRSCGVLDRRAA